MEKRRFNSIDFCKLVMALFVVAMHTDPLVHCQLDIANKMYSVFAPMAVPFFFMAAGFLLGSKMHYPFHGDNNIRIVRNYLKKCIKLYLIWSVVYFPLAIFHYISENVDLLTAVLMYIRGLLFIGEHYNSWHLWYLLSSIYALLGIIFLLKRNQSIKMIVCIGFVVFLIGIGITYLTRHYEGDYRLLIVIKELLVYSVSSGRILSGFFYIPVGMYLSKRIIGNKVFLIMLVGGIITNRFSPVYGISSVLIALYSIGFFGVIEELHIDDSILFPFVRKMSTVIYFIHMYVWSFYYKIRYGEKTYGIDSFLITVLISCTIAIIYIWAKSIYAKNQIYSQNDV